MTANTGTGICQAAYEDAGLCSLGQTISTAQGVRGLARLNDIINFEATQGLKLWLQQVITVQPIAAQPSYRLGVGGVSGNTIRPLQVLQGTYLTSSFVRQPLVPISRDEYTRLSQTVGNDSAINSFFEDRKASYTDIFLWNTPDAQAATGTVDLVCRISLDQSQMASISATTVFPLEWALFLRWALADEVAVGQSDSIQSRCAIRAAQYREALDSFDVEDAPTMFQPDSRTTQYSNKFR